MTVYHHDLDRYLRDVAQANVRIAVLHRAALDMFRAQVTFAQIGAALGVSPKDAYRMVQYELKRWSGQVTWIAAYRDELERAGEVNSAWNDGLRNDDCAEDEEVENERANDRAADRADPPERLRRRAHANVRVAALQAAALELRIAGWTYEQIAVAFGVSEHEVSSMAHRALTKRIELMRWSARH